MDDRAPRPTQKCGTCGALNGADFGRCIRCGQPLSRAATPGPLGRSPDPTSLPATKLLMGLTVLVFAGQLLAGRARGEMPSLLGAGHPADALRFGALLVRPALVASEPLRVLSAVFVHFGILHIAMNLFVLLGLARFAEPAVGSARFLIAYVVTGAASFGVTVAYSLLSGDAPFTAGASGAVFGVMGLVLGFLARRRDPRWKQFALQAVLYSVLFGFAINASGGGVLVNNSAHLGGLCAGILFGVAFAGRRAPNRSELPANIGAAMALAATIASLVLSQLSPIWR